MTEASPQASQVAVYIDFDNIVISRYDELHGRDSFKLDGANASQPKVLVRERLVQARVDVGAILNYAATFGSVVASRAYADWSRPVSRSYSTDMLKRSVDLVQLFPMTGMKNGADIRLAIDATDDLAQYPNITHIVVVAGDSDYVALAQRCKRRGRVVIGVGASQSVGQYWRAACDEFKLYGSLVSRADSVDQAVAAGSGASATDGETDAGSSPELLAAEAARLLYLKTSNDWISQTNLKPMMKRLDNSFDEAQLGFSTFGAFVRSLSGILEIDPVNKDRLTLKDRVIGARGSGSGAPSDGVVVSAEVKSETQNDLSGLPLPHQPPPATELVKRVRGELNIPTRVVIGNAGMDLAIPAMRVAWRKAQAGEASTANEVVAGLAGDGVEVVAARRIVNLVMLTVPYMLRDANLVQHPNPDLLGLSDADLRQYFDLMLGQRIHVRLGGATGSFDEVISALFGLDTPAPQSREQLRTGWEAAGFLEMKEAIGALLIPPPVLWDVATAVATVVGQARIWHLDELMNALREPLERNERDLDTVDPTAVHLSLMECGIIASADSSTLPELPEVVDESTIVGSILSGWLAKCRAAGLAVKCDDPIAMDALYKIVLPDRSLIEWREWVRDVVSYESTYGQQ